MTQSPLLAQLAPVAEALLERHLRTTKEWFPHELVPYERARAFVPGEGWQEDDASLDGTRLDPGVRSALFVNLLTEDNLPYYTRDVDRLFGADDAFGTWVRRWTAEEGRHSIVIRDYLTVTRAIDPVALERGRMAQVSRGEVPRPLGLEHGLVYLTLQELATRIAHRTTGKVMGDGAGYEVMARVAADENLHHLFYRDLATAAIDVEPSTMMEAIEHEVRTFAMPGTGIPGFDTHAAAIARAGIYDLAIHYEQILVPVVLRHWRIEERAGLTDAAERARDRVLARIERTGRIGRELAERRNEAAAATAPA